MSESNNAQLVTIKAHYFFFMAAMGPILPQLSVFGKQLNVPPDIMGYIACVLPIIYVVAKPIVNFLSDYYVAVRKFMFVVLILIMTGCFAGFYFIPRFPHSIDKMKSLHLNILSEKIPKCGKEIYDYYSMCTTMREMSCIGESKQPLNLHVFAVEFTNISTANNNLSLQTISIPDVKIFYICHKYNVFEPLTKHKFICNTILHSVPNCDEHLDIKRYIILLSVGTISLYIVNAITDAICLNILGAPQEKKFGAQRVWGTIGFGLAALLEGFVVQFWTMDNRRSFIPAIVIMVIFIGLDLMSLYTLRIPKLSPESFYSDARYLFQQKQVATFLVFATIFGALDSFINYFMFWQLEDVAAKTKYMESIKFIEGFVIAFGCLFGEIPMIFFSGKIIRKIGYVHTFSLCFFMYAIRLALISLILNPWWLVGLELVIRGYTYTLTCTCIHAYAAGISAIGASTTAQDIAAIMMNRLGYVYGPLIGGNLYKWLGGARSFQVFAGAAVIACISHIILKPGSKHGGNKSTRLHNNFDLPSAQCSEI